MQLLPILFAICFLQCVSHAAETTDFSQTLDDTPWTLQDSEDASLSTEHTEQGLAFDFHGPNKSAKAVLTREIDLSQYNEIRIPFTLGDPALIGSRIIMEAGGTAWGTGVHDDGMFALYGPQPHYAGPRWQAGENHEVRWKFNDDGDFDITIVTPDGLPQADKKYTRPIPESWKDGVVKLSIVARSKTTDPGSATIKSATIFAPDDERPEHQASSNTVKQSLDKYLTLRNGELTSTIKHTIASLDKKRLDIQQPEGILVQLWDAHKLTRSGLSDDQVQALKQRFNLLQFRSVPDTDIRNKLENMDLGWALYVTTRDPALYAALKNSPAPQTRFLRKGEWTDRANPLSGDLAELATIATLKQIAPYATNGQLKQILLDSEYEAGVGDDPIAHALAEQDGLEIFELNPPERGQDDFTLTIPESDPQWQFDRWRRDHDTLNVTHRTIANSISKLWPGLRVTTDPIMDNAALTQFYGLDAVQHWIRVHYAPRHPRSVGYFAERSRAHLRGLPGRKDQPTEIIIGPQLGRDGRGTPVDMLSEACWLAIAHGARGLTHWGAHCIYEEDGSFAPNGEAAWQILKRMREEVYEPHADLLTRWQPTPRRAAMLVSNVDQQHDAGGRHQQGPEATENMYRALMATGEPVDVIYDEQIHAGELDQYEVLFVPSLYVADQALLDCIKAFETNGGTVVTHSNSALEANLPNVTIIEQNLAPRYRDYWIRKGETSLRPDEYAAFLNDLTETLKNSFPFKTQISVNRNDVSINLMELDGKEYIVLVNDNRTYGKEREALGHPYMLDKGMETKVILEGVDGKSYQDVISGEKYQPDANDNIEVELAPGWGAILESVNAEGA